MSTVAKRNSKLYGTHVEVAAATLLYVCLRIFLSQVEDVPSFGMGHSLGSVIHLLIGRFIVHALSIMLKLGVPGINL